MPTSKETRVRLEGFWKTIASVLPRSGLKGYARPLEALEPHCLVEYEPRLFRRELGEGEAIAAGEGGGG